MRQKERTFFDEHVEVTQRRDDGDVRDGVMVELDFVGIGLKLGHNVRAVNEIPKSIRYDGGGRRVHAGDMKL